MYNALLQASSFYKGNSEQVIQKARTVFSEFDIIQVGFVGRSKFLRFNPPLNQMEYWFCNKRLLKYSFKCSIHYDSDSEEEDNEYNDYNRKTCVCGTKINFSMLLRIVLLQNMCVRSVVSVSGKLQIQIQHKL